MACALSIKGIGSLGYVQTIYYLLLIALRDMRVRLGLDYFGALLTSFHVWRKLIN